MIEAWLEAVRDQLREEMVAVIPGGEDNAGRFIDVQFQGRPPAKMGDWFIGIDESRVESTEKAQLRESYTIDVVITRRTGQFKASKLASIYLQNAKGLGPLERLVIKHLHNSHETRARADAYVDAPTRQGFKQPLWYAGRGRTLEKRAEWAGGAGDETFLVRTLVFSGGTREQAMDVIT